MAILGFGTVTSVFFLVIAMIKTIGKSIIMIYLFLFKFNSIALTCFDINGESYRTEEKGKPVNILE